MRLVLRIGGSVIASPVDPQLIEEYADLLKRLRRSRHDVVAVVGGGSLAREFIQTAKDLGLTEQSQDEIAISVSRLFAQLLLKKLGNAGCKNVPLTVEEAAKYVRRRKIVVMGGLRPGMTTDTVAALLAKKTGADLLIKATDQDGIYDKDPKKHADAVKLDHLSFRSLTRVMSENKHIAGIHQIIDPEAIKILRYNRTKVAFVNGFEPRNVMKVIEGKQIGTLID
jgi:uridylate kinase